MRNSIAHGKNVATRAVALQLTGSVVTALVAAVFGWRSALAALAGGFAIAIGNLLFAVRLFGRGVMPARNALHAAYAAEVIKWFWVCATLYVAIAVWKLPFLPLFAGLMAAQLCFWIALIATR